MMKLLTFIFTLSVLFGCSNQENFITTTYSYGLKGNVKFFSEKSINVVVNSNNNYILDNEPNINITNKYFQKNRQIEKIEYFQSDDSILSEKRLYDYHFKDKIFAISYDKDGNKNNLLKLVSFKDSIVEVHTIDNKTKKLVSTSYTKYEKGIIVWQKSTETKNNIQLENIYSRDEKGFEIAIKRKMIVNNISDTMNIQIKYLEFDTHGNWTKRIEYNPVDKNGILKSRQIKYYK